MLVDGDRTWGEDGGFNCDFAISVGQAQMQFTGNADAVERKNLDGARGLFPGEEAKDASIHHRRARSAYMFLRVDDNLTVPIAADTLRTEANRHGLPGHGERARRTGRIGANDRRREHGKRSHQGNGEPALRSRVKLCHMWFNVRSTQVVPWRPEGFSRHAWVS